MTTAISIPRLGPIVRHATPTVLECNLVPAAVFAAALQLAGVAAAVVAAWAWVLGALVRRAWTNKPIPGMLVLAGIGLTIRSALALATGSLVVYFVQPAAGTAMVAAAFFVSVPLGRPLAERLALDICPFDQTTSANPALRSFLAQVSILWGIASTVNVAVTLWLLWSQPVATFVIAKAALGPVITVVFAAGATLWFRSSMARQGVPVHWGQPA